MSDRIYQIFEGTTGMADMTFSIWRLVVENNDAGLMSKLANRDTFAKLITTIDPIRIHPNDKEAFSVSVKTRMIIFLDD